MTEVVRRHVRSLSYPEESEMGVRIYHYIYAHIFIFFKKKKEKNLRKFLHNEKCNKRLFSRLVKIAENPYKKLELLLHNYCWYVYYSFIDLNGQTD